MDKPERIVSLDVLRGFALLGILLMNIQSFSMPTAAYGNPTVYGDFEGVNYWVWLVGHVVGEQKFMSIFSMLFGAGLYIFYQRALAKGLDASALHKRRMLWLALFGILHAYLIWYGDILFSYAVCGLVAIKFVDASFKKLLLSGVALLLVPVLVMILLYQAHAFHAPEDLAVIIETWSPTQAQIDQEIQQYQGSWFASRIESAKMALVLQTVGLLLFTFFYSLAMMLFGMGLLKAGFLGAQNTHSTYRVVAILGLALGVSLASYGVYQNLQHGFSVEYSSYLGPIFNYFGAIFSAIAYSALIMLWVLSQRFSGVLIALANVGKMAFTNYIMQSVICTFVFYGFGLGYYGQLSRVEALYVVLLVWVFQLLLSTLYLRRFRQGPLESLWRKLTYLKL